MNKKLTYLLTASSIITLSQSALAGTDTFFTPLTSSAVVADPSAVVELDSPWVAPAGLVQKNLTSMDEIEGDPEQTVVRVPGTGTQASMWDMVAYDDKGKFAFIPHETPWGAGLSRYDIKNDVSEVLFAGDQGGATNNWANDWAAFDPATFTPNKTVLVAEEWSGEGRVMEVLNPFAQVDQIQIRELESIANVAHEGLRFSLDGRTLYFVDEWNSGSLYKFVSKKKGDYTKGQTFVLVVDAFAGDPAADYNQGVNAGATRVGPATWVPITDAVGNKLTIVDPFRNGPTDDPRTSSITRGGRPAADEVNGTPYGRPEDMEIGKLASGREVMYVTATSENAVYSVEFLDKTHAVVRLAASQAVTPKNLGHAATTGALNSPDNLAQDALGNIYVIEDAPNASLVGGDIWLMRDTNTDGVAESLDHFLSIQVHGSEATGMIWNPKDPTKFVVSIQHPSSVDLGLPGSLGDALWQFDVSGVSAEFTKALKKAAQGGCSH